MTDLQAKFAVTLVALGAIFSYVVPTMKEMKHHHDAVVQQVGQAYATPDPAAAPAIDSSGSDDAQK
jgi:hypothetical protein